MKLMSLSTEVRPNDFETRVSRTTGGATEAPLVEGRDELAPLFFACAPLPFVAWTAPLDCGRSRAALTGRIPTLSTSRLAQAGLSDR